MKLRTVFPLLCCTLVIVIRARADQGEGEGVPDSKVDLFLKTLEEILDDLELIEEEEEKNGIDSGMSHDTRKPIFGDLRSGKSQTSR